MVGMGTPIQTLQLSAAHLKEVDIIGIFRYCNTYRHGNQDHLVRSDSGHREPHHPSLPGSGGFERGA